MLGLPPPPFQPTHLSHHPFCLRNKYHQSLNTLSGLAEASVWSAHFSVWWPLLVRHTPPLHKPGQAVVQESLIPPREATRLQRLDRTAVSMCVLGEGAYQILDKAASRNAVCVCPHCPPKRVLASPPTPDLPRPSSTFTCSAQLCFLLLQLSGSSSPSQFLTSSALLQVASPHQPHPGLLPQLVLRTILHRKGWTVLGSQAGPDGGEPHCGQAGSSETHPSLPRTGNPPQLQASPSQRPASSSRAGLAALNLGPARKP